MNEVELRSQRTKAVRNLVELRVPVDQAVSELARFGWDSAEELVTLTRADVMRLLERYRRHELTAAECQRWAESLEGRDDVGLEVGFTDTLKEFLFQLATPELTEPLTSGLATRWEAIFRAEA